MIETAPAIATVSFSWKSIWEAVLRYFAALRHKRPTHRLRVTETLAIGEKRQLLVVECGNRQMLIGTAANFIAKLAELGAVPDTENNGRG